MTGKRASVVWLALVGAGLIVFGLGWVYPAVHRMREQQGTIERLEKEKAGLAKKLEDLTERFNLLLASEGAEVETADPRLSALSRLSGEERAKRLEQLKMLGEIQDRLSNATATVKQLEARVQELEQTAIKADEGKRSLTVAEADLKQRLADSNRVIEAMQAELKSSSDRITGLEARNKALAAQQRDLDSKTTNTAKYVQELEDIHRRQEAIMTSILQRYREANDRYRSLALRMDEPQRDAPASGADLSQIGNLVSLVEEDLRQLRNLNAQAARIQRQLGR